MMQLKTIRKLEEELRWKATQPLSEWLPLDEKYKARSKEASFQIQLDMLGYKEPSDDSFYGWWNTVKGIYERWTHKADYVARLINMLEEGIPYEYAMELIE